MRFVHAIVIGLLVLSAGVGAAAGQADQKQGKPLEAKPAAQPLVVARASGPKPGPQIERLLRALEGTWAIKEKFAPDAASPNGSTGEGRIVWRPGPGGFSVIEDYQSKEGNKEVIGLAVFWWDETAQGYRNIWCDSTNPTGCINFKNAARWEGSQLVLVEDYEINGKKVTFKEVFGDITAAVFTQTLYGGDQDGELKVDQTIHATKLTRSLDGDGQPK